MTNSQTNNHNTFFLIGGMTGGPIVPLLAYQDAYPNAGFIIIGVKNSFEEQLAHDKGWKFIAVPKAKRSIDTLSTTSTSFLDKVLQKLSYIPIAWKLAVGMLVSFFALLSYKPTAIISAGGFVSVPVAYALKIAKIVGIKTRMIIHQQDIHPTQSNVMVARFAHAISVVTSKTQTLNPCFANAFVTPNLLQQSRFDPSVLQQTHNHLLSTQHTLLHLLENSKKPILFVFGGGSGALYLNHFIEYFFDTLLKYYSIIHVTGPNKDTASSHSHPDYYKTEFFDIATQSYVLYHSDVVIARAGMGTISELLYLHKKAFLLPIPHTHQLLNADYFSKDFGVWKYDEYDFTPQPFHAQWIQQIIHPDIAKHHPTHINQHYVNAMKKYFAWVDTQLTKF